MGESSKTVAIIGCGVTGLAAVKCSLDEGLQPTCFEMSDDIGGLWYYRDNATCPMKASVFKSTVTNTSKEAMCYSDFPFPKEWPNFSHNSSMKKYCDMYAERFGLKDYIRFSTRVTHLEQAQDYDTSGRWVVTAKHNYEEGETSSNELETSQEFDAVMICTGMFTNPIIPDFPGLDEFQGKVLHSHDYRRPEGFEGKRVVVVGLGNSASDAASDVSRHASQVYLSVRRGTWIFSRRGDYGTPWDLMYFRRFHCLPSQIDMILLKQSLKHRYDMICNSLRPAHDLTACEPLITEDLPGCILTGSVVIKATPAKFTKTGVQFIDGTYENNIDAVIMATGYTHTLPFDVSCPALEIKNGHLPLYKLVFPLGLMHNTLSVNGVIKPLGAVIPCIELQARWAARVFKGLADLPSQSEMEVEVKTVYDTMEKVFLPSYHHVNPRDYANYIAAEIGVKPNYLKLFFTEPVLTIRCLWGPHVPYKYRLVGPGKWDGARKAINRVWEHVLEPTKTRRVDEAKEGTHFLGVLIFLFIAFLAILAAIFLR